MENIDDNKAGLEGNRIPSKMQHAIQQKFQKSQTSQQTVVDNDGNDGFVVTDENYDTLKSNPNLTDVQREKLEEYVLKKKADGDNSGSSDDVDDKNSNSGDKKIELENLPDGITEEEVKDKLKDISEKPEEERTEEENLFVEDFGSILDNEVVKTPLHNVFEELSITTDKYDLSKEDDIKKAISDLSFEAARNIIKEDKELAEFYEHKKNGGTLDTFRVEQKVKDFSKVKIVDFDDYDGDERDTHYNNVRNIIDEDLKRKGISDKLRNATINSLESEGSEVLLEEARQAKQRIVDEDNKIIDSQKAQHEQQLQQIEQNNTKYLEAVKSNNFGVNFKVPEETLLQFNMAANDKLKAKELIDKKWENLPVEKLALLDAIVFSDFKILEGSKGLSNFDKKYNERKTTLSASRDYSSIFNNATNGNQKVESGNIDAFREALRGKNLGETFAKQVKKIEKIK